MQVNYTSRNWLNDTSSPSTGSVFIYDGEDPWRKPDEPDKRYQFIEISDCRNSVRLHKMERDTNKQWKNKIDCLVKDLLDYQKWLEENPVDSEY